MSADGNQDQPVTVSEQVDLALMQEVLTRYQGQDGALIPILQGAQEIYGYLPGEVLRLIAKRLGVAVSKVYGVATFYAQFYLERRGRHVLKLCDGTACHVKGTPTMLTAIHDSFAVEPGQTTGDGQLTLEIVYCVGSCALAPVAVLDGAVMGRMRQETLLRRVRRQMVASE
jgi:NADH-quinone oxidoreductase subunit E